LIYEAAKSLLKYIPFKNKNALMGAKIIKKEQEDAETIPNSPEPDPD
jgi:hypothetical protein